MALVPHKPLAHSVDELSEVDGKGFSTMKSTSTTSEPIESSTKSYDQALFDVLRVSPEDFATQITLMDHEVFLRIKPDELSSCVWNTRQKHEVAPNVVSFTKRFNQVNFWVQRTVLGEKGVSKRAEVMSHFIKVAKQCYALNNLHAVMAIISALQSASIFRLSCTWSNLSKKDRSSYEKMSDLFSETNNRQKLRDYMDGVKLPVIPYLGLYLTDLTYIDVAHPFSGGMETEMRKIKMNNILRLISEYQCSQYTLPCLEHIKNYLNTQHYIEELQKFVEDDNYKMSLLLEPATSNSSLELKSDKSHDDISVSRNSRHHSSTDSFVPKHRKTKSLGTNTLSTYEKTQSLPMPSQDGQPSRHLIDDSEVPGATPIRSNLPVARRKPDFGLQLLGCGMWSLARDDDDEPPRVLPGSSQALYGGCLKRRALLKRGKRPRLAKWKRFWVQIWGTNLLYYPEKKSAGSSATRADFKSDPSKMVSVSGWLVVLCDDPDHPDAFQLSSDSGHVYKFLAGSRTQAVEWVQKVSRATGCVEPKIPENLMTFQD